METRLTSVIRAVVLAMIFAGCSHEKRADPDASVQSQFPDRRLYEAAMQSMAAKKYVDGLSLLHTLIDSYPNSPYVGRAKLALDDCNRHDECAAIRAQYEALPNGGGMIFFPAMPVKTDATTKKHRKNVR